MNGMKVFIFLLPMALHSVYAIGPFFHESAANDLKPLGLSLAETQTSYFGFSIGFQNSNTPRLVVGAPKKDFVGQVYSCPLTVTKGDIDCTMIDMTSLDIQTKTKKAREELNPNINFFFGSTIAATPDYFLTCAPLLTKSIITEFVNKSDVCGGCFVYDNKASTYSEWVDTTVRLENAVSKTHPSWPPLQYTDKTSHFYEGGSVGWSSLVEENNGLLLVSKSIYIGDIMYVDSKKPLTPTKSFSESIIDFAPEDLYNFGFGLAVGNFYEKDVKLYAVSTSLPNWTGQIIFLSETSSSYLEIYNDIELINEKDIDAMFGYALAAADLNQDGFSDLLVGAPGQSDKQTQTEYGALHIYIGDEIGDKIQIILGNVENGRFGSAIATNDIDGDNLPEIFVSAPYENSGYGTVYVISGYELNQNVLKNYELRISELKLTQELHGDSDARLFGFSLQVVKDVNEDGCDELAVGSPDSSLVRLFRCLPAVTTSISFNQIGDEIIKETADSFTMEVCVNVVVSAKCKKIAGSILVESTIDGDTSILSPKFEHHLESGNNRMCNNIYVQLKTTEAAKYIFSTKLTLLDGYNKTDPDFKPWAVLSPQSETEKSKEIDRHCTGDCKPKLSCAMHWSGGKYIDTSMTKSDTASIVVSNIGEYSVNTAAHVRLMVQGGQISTSQCYKENGTDMYYLCSPERLRAKESYDISLMHIMKDPTNIRSFSISAEIIDKGFPAVSCEPKDIQIEYTFDTDLVNLTGLNRDLNMTDKDLEEIVVFNDHHEYYIRNNGLVKWVDLQAVLQVKNETFIQKIVIFSTEVCPQNYKSDDPSYIEFHCRLTLEPGAEKKIRGSFEISMKSIDSDVKNGKLGTRSQLSLKLNPTAVVLNANSTTQFIYKNILTVGNRKELVIIIIIAVAVLLLLLLIFILYKYGFFKRMQKQKLESLRESVRKRSVRQASESSKSRKPSTAEGVHCEMEVEDCVFQEVDMNSEQCTNDNVELIEQTTTAQVHS